MQFGASALPELHHFAGLNFEQRASLLRARDGKSLRTLLDFHPDLARNFFDRIPQSVPRVKISTPDQQHQSDCCCSKPAAKTGELQGHSDSVLCIEVVLQRSLRQQEPAGCVAGISSLIFAYGMLGVARSLAGKESVLPCGEWHHAEPALSY